MDTTSTDRRSAAQSRKAVPWGPDRATWLICIGCRTPRHARKGQQGPHQVAVRNHPPRVIRHVRETGHSGDRTPRPALAAPTSVAVRARSSMTLRRVLMPSQSGEIVLINGFGVLFVILNAFGLGLRLPIGKNTR